MHLERPMTIQLFNSEGRCVYIAAQCYSSHINLPKVNSGAYFLSIVENEQPGFISKIFIQ